MTARRAAKYALCCIKIHRQVKLEGEYNDVKIYGLFHLKKYNFILQQGKQQTFLAYEKLGKNIVVQPGIHNLHYCILQLQTITFSFPLLFSLYSIFPFTNVHGTPHMLHLRTDRHFKPRIQQHQLTHANDWYKLHNGVRSMHYRTTIDFTDRKKPKDKIPERGTHFLYFWSFLLPVFYKSLLFIVYL